MINLNKFPEQIAIAYAYCDATNNCDNKQFIVDGQTQVCNKCNGTLFRDEVRNYTLKKSNHKKSIQRIIEFPESIEVSYAICNNQKCHYGEYVVKKEFIKCQYCGNRMILRGTEKYYLSHATFICPICGYDKLFFEPYDKKGKGSYDICPNCKNLFFDYKMDKVDIKRKKFFSEKKR